jgi:hypothetical protein
LKSTNIEKTQGAKEKGKEKEEILGAMGIDLKRKDIIIFKAKCVILATGGYTRVYPVSSSRIFENYGDGIALAYEAGVDLVDMEMVQFHPTGMVWPKKALGTLATEAIRGEGGILLNSKGERFMKNYYPQRMELGQFITKLFLEEVQNMVVFGWTSHTCQKRKFWKDCQPCTTSSSALQELISLRRKWKLLQLRIIRWEVSKSIRSVKQM